MGKYGIGAKVRDVDGDLAEVVGKSKGWRDVRLLGGKHDGLLISYPKSSLVPANDQEVVAEGDEVLAGQDVSENACGWVPKVGDRVRFKEDNPNGGPTYGKAGQQAVVSKTDIHEGVFGPYGLQVEIEDPGCGWNPNAPISALEPVVAPATTTVTDKLTIEAGKFYRTRDGRKVGPILDFATGIFHVAAGTIAGNQLWSADGAAILDDDCNDLVAEWVEPEPEVAVSEAPATLNGVYGKPGLIVRCEAWRGELFTVGREYTFDADGQVTSDDGEKWSNIYSGEWSLVTPAAPPEKFKVGDKVDLYRDGELVEPWRNMTITEDARDGVFEFNTDVGMLCNSRELRLSPTIPIGSTVTFTATGRLSAINENGHYQVTFPGLPAARNSFALPAEYVSLAK